MKKTQHRRKAAGKSQGPRVSTSTLKIGQSVKTDKIEFAPSPNRGSAYQPLIDKVEKTPVNESFVVPLPPGVTTESFHNRLTMAFQRVKPKLKPGTKMRKGTDVQGNVVISIMPIKPAKSKSKPKAKASK